jgi:hypothetical protein
MRPKKFGYYCSSCGEQSDPPVLWEIVLDGLCLWSFYYANKYYTSNPTLTARFIIIPILLRVLILWLFVPLNPEKWD